MAVRIKTGALKEELNELGGLLQSLVSALTDSRVKNQFSEITLHRLEKTGRRLTELYPPQEDKREQMSLQEFVRYMAEKHVERENSLNSTLLVNECLDELLELKQEQVDTPGQMPGKLLTEANRASRSFAYHPSFDGSIEHVIYNEIQEYFGEGETS